MKVIQLISHFDMGGAERIAINIAKSTSGVEYHMVEVVRGCSEFTEGFIDEMKNNGIVYHRSNIKNNKLAIILFPIRFRKLLNLIKPDVIHTHTEMPDLALYLCHLLMPWKLKGVKIVRTLHNTLLWDKWKGIGNRVEKYMIKKKANVSNSLMISAMYQKEYGPDNNLRLIYNGFDASTQEEYDFIKPGRINVLFAGRFVPQKGINTMVETILAVNSEKLYFHIAGKGELEDVIRNALGNRENVSIVPPIYNLARFLGSFDYVWIPSVHEGLNSLSIEASLNRTPVIINDIEGLNETVPPNYQLKVTDNSVEEYKELFRQIENTDASVFVDDLYDYAKNHFSLHVMQQKYEEMYEEA